MRWSGGTFSPIAVTLLVIIATSSRPIDAEPHIRRMDGQEGARLEIKCIIDGRDYCQDKPTGFEYDDGCRDCQCRDHEGFCRSDHCERTVNIGTDPGDYCRDILDKNSRKLHENPHSVESEKPPERAEPELNEGNHEAMDDKKSKESSIAEPMAVSVEAESKTLGEQSLDDKPEEKPSDSESAENPQPVAFVGPKAGPPGPVRVIHGKPKRFLIHDGRTRLSERREPHELMRHPLRPEPSEPSGPPGIIRHPEPLGPSRPAGLLEHPEPSGPSGPLGLPGRPEPLRPLPPPPPPPPPPPGPPGLSGHPESSRPSGPLGPPGQPESSRPSEPLGLPGQPESSGPSGPLGLRGRPEPFGAPAPPAPLGILGRPSEPSGLPMHPELLRGAEPLPLNPAVSGPLGDLPPSMRAPPHPQSPAIHNMHQPIEGPKEILPNIGPMRPFQGSGHEPIPHPDGPMEGPMRNPNGPLSDQSVSFNDMLNTPKEKPLEPGLPLSMMDRNKDSQLNQRLFELFTQAPKQVKINNTKKGDGKLLFGQYGNQLKSSGKPTRKVNSKDESFVDRLLNMFQLNGQVRQPKQKQVRTEKLKPGKLDKNAQNIGWNQSPANPDWIGMPPVNLGLGSMFRPDGPVDGPIDGPPHHPGILGHERQGLPGVGAPSGPSPMGPGTGVGIPQGLPPLNGPFIAGDGPGALLTHAGPGGIPIGPDGPSMGPSGPMMGPGGPMMGPGGPMMGPGGPLMGSGIPPMESGEMGPPMFGNEVASPLHPGSPHHAFHGVGHGKRVPRLGLDGLEAVKQTANKAIHDRSVVNGTASRTGTKQKLSLPEPSGYIKIPGPEEGTFLLAARILPSPKSDEPPNKVDNPIEKTSSFVNGMHESGDGELPGMWAYSGGSSMRHMIQEIRELRREVNYWRQKYTICEAYRKKIRSALNTEIQRPHNAAYSMRELCSTALPLLFGGFWLRRLI